MTNKSFSTTELSLANALAHDILLPYLQTVYIGCERCGNPHLLIVDYSEDPAQEELGDIILQTHYFFKCPSCGFEEMDAIITVIPSWQWHPYRNSDLNPKQIFEEKIHIKKLWSTNDIL